MKINSVLLVEDSLTMRRILRKVISEIGVPDIVEAENGIDALTKLNNKPVDLIMTDWNMPEMNGEDLIKKLRSMEQYQKTPILMITTRATKEDVIRALQIGVNSYITKPFTPKLLQEKVNAVMQ